MAGTKLNVLPTNISGLDPILGGGVPAGSLLMVVGAPGTGKTLMLQQFCFNFARYFNQSDAPPASPNPSSQPKAIKALYFSTLSEPHEKLIQHIGQFQFFDETLLNEQIKFFSLTGAMEQGLDSVMETIVETVRQERPKLVAIDGFAALEALEAGSMGIRRALYRLSGQLGFLGITVLLALERNLLTEMSGLYASSEELTIGDGIVYLSSRMQGVQTIRQVEVRKLRGMNMLTGAHTYQISGEGLKFYPRTEVLSDRTLYSGITANNDRRLTFNLPELEKMLDGGLPLGSSTVVAGSPGVGKTLLGLHYLLAGAANNEPCLYLGFYEGKVQLIRKARQFGLDLGTAIENGLVQMLTLTPVELNPDQVVWQVRQLVEQHKIRRVVIDGLTELEIACRPQQRSRAFIAAIVNYFKSQEITALYTHEISKLIGLELDLSDDAFTPLAENLLLLKQVEYKTQLYRVLAVLKMRDSTYDRTIREFTIAVPGGIKVLEPLQSGDGLLGGLARVLGQS